MSDICHFNHVGYCIIDREESDLNCEYKGKWGLCKVPEDVLITEEEYWELNRSGR